MALETHNSKLNGRLDKSNNPKASISYQSAEQIIEPETARNILILGLS
jgi:hypothetical protein